MSPPLQGQQWKLYEMILQRTLASAMADAQLDLTTVDVAATAKGGGGCLSRVGNCSQGARLDACV